MRGEAGSIPGIRPIGYHRGRPIWPIMGGDGTEPDGSAGTGEPPAPDLSHVPASIRQSPEFRALESQNRALARKAGAAEAEAARAREAAEHERQAAEAKRAQEMEQQLTSLLGTDGIAAWNDIAALTATDPVAAAKRFREVMAKGTAQSAPATDPAANAAAASAPATPAGGTVPNTPPPPPSGGVDGGQPLGQPATGEDTDKLIASLSKTYSDVVERNQNAATRNRVTMRDRGNAFIAYLGAAVLKATQPGPR